MFFYKYCIYLKKTYLVGQLIWQLLILFHPLHKNRAIYQLLIDKLPKTPLSKEKHKKEVQWIKYISIFDSNPMIIQYMIYKRIKIIKENRRAIHFSNNNMKNNITTWKTIAYSSYAKQI